MINPMKPIMRNMTSVYNLQCKQSVVIISSNFIQWMRMHFIFLISTEKIINVSVSEKKVVNTLGAGKGRINF